MSSAGDRSTSVRNDPPRPLLAFVPPPLWFVAAFAGGVGLQRLVGSPDEPPRVAAVIEPAGVALLIVGIGLLCAAFVRFGLARTPILPQSAPRSLVVGGAYRLTRNPMYIGLTLVHVGSAATIHALYAALLVALPLALLQTVIVPFEERRLAARFGDAYAAYRARVRRWL